MLLDFFHRHRRAILVLVIIFVGLPMGVLFGIPNPFVSDNTARYDEIVIEVRGVPVDAQTFLGAVSNLTDSYRAQGQEVPSTQELIADGTINELIRDLADDAYLTSVTADKPYRPTNDYLDKRLREYPDFKNEAGQFDPKLYNRWVTFTMERGGDWNSIRGSVAEQVKRDTLIALLTASSRVFESDLRERYETMNTKVRVRFAEIEPPVEIDEEALRAYYEQNADQYQTAERRRATVVAIPIEIEQPAIAGELIQRARDGEDFAELAREHSVSGSGPDGGEVGWLRESDTVAEHRRPVFAMQPGDISDPIQGPFGLHIYKVESERIDPDTEEREVFVREIVLTQRPSPEAVDAAVAAAQELAESLRAGTSPDAVAREKGYSTLDTGYFDRNTFELDGIAPGDAPSVRQALSGLQRDGVSEPVNGRKHVYVGQVVEVLPPENKSFEAARVEVKEDWVAEQKDTPEYHNRVHEYLEKIAEDGVSLDEAASKYPELELEPAETKLFGATDLLFEEGWMVDPSEVIRTAAELEVGEIGGPVADFQGIEYVVEVLEKQGPTEEMWENDWPQVRASMRQSMREQLAAEHLDDYLLHGMERATENEEVYVFQEAIEVLLGVDAAQAPDTGTSTSGEPAAGDTEPATF